MSAKSVFKPNDPHGLYEEDWRTPVLISGEDRFGHIKYATTLEKIYANSDLFNKMPGTSRE